MDCFKTLGARNCCLHTSQAFIAEVVPLQLLLGFCLQLLYAQLVSCFAFLNYNIPGRRKASWREDSMARTPPNRCMPFIDCCFWSSVWSFNRALCRKKIDTKHQRYTTYCKNSEFWLYKIISLIA